MRHNVIIDFMEEDDYLFEDFQAELACSKIRAQMVRNQDPELIDKGILQVRISGGRSTLENWMSNNGYEDYIRFITF